MPIRWLYPIDWRELSASIRFDRAAGRCEKCGRPHGREVLHAGKGSWFDRQRGIWRDGSGIDVGRPAKPYRLRWTFVWLATCQLDHDPTNNAPTNLRAWCQRCHLMNDAPEHRRRRAVTALLRRAIGDLFTGPYLPT